MTKTRRIWHVEMALRNRIGTIVKDEFPTKSVVQYRHGQQVRQVRVVRHQSGYNLFVRGHASPDGYSLDARKIEKILIIGPR